MAFGRPQKLLFAKRAAAALGYIGLASEDRVVVAALSGHTGEVFSAMFSADGALLSAPVELDGDPRLIRCDRVDFPPGGVAYLHTHQGPGVRVLLHGTIRIDTAGRSIASTAWKPARNSAAIKATSVGGVDSRWKTRRSSC